MEASQVQTVLIVGLGQMGQGIAQVCAQAGLKVLVSDQDDEKTTLGITRVFDRLGRAEKKGTLTSEQAIRIRSRITASSLEHAAPHAQLAIESVSEDLELKSEILSRLDARLPKMSVLATNTSSISISKLAAATGRAPRVLGMHFMNPVPVIPLVELVQGIETSPHTLDFAQAFVQRLDKTSVVSEDRPGFIVNRILIPMLNEACFALQDSLASVEDIDTAIQLGLNHPMGPLRLADLIGLDTVLAIAETLHSEFGDDKYRPSVLLRNLVAAGRLGNKTGRGFYVYESGKPVGPALKYAMFTRERE